MLFNHHLPEKKQVVNRQLSRFQTHHDKLPITAILCAPDFFEPSMSLWSSRRTLFSSLAAARVQSMVNEWLIHGYFMDDDG